MGKRNAWLFLMLGIGLVLAGISTARGEPYLAVRTGFKCSQCHLNKSGGGKRTAFGAIYAQTFLPRVQMKTESNKSFFNGYVSEHVSFGGNLRLTNITVFGVDRPRRAYQRDNFFDIPEGNLYLQLDVVKDFLTFYMDEIMSPVGAQSREAFGMIHNLPFNGYIKAGRLLLPYGLRLLDDDAFIRQKTGFTYDNQDLAVEVGIEPGPFSLIVSGSNGVGGPGDNNLDKQFTSVGSVVFRHFRVGGSFARNRVPDILRYTYGGFAGLYFGRFTLLGEVDVIEERVKGQEEQRKEQGDRLAGFAEMDILLTRGINLKVAYDYFDPHTKIEEDHRYRLTTGIEAFVTQFLQFRALYIFADSVPQKPREREDSLILELHTFF